MNELFSSYTQNLGIISTFVGTVLSFISFVISILVLKNTAQIKKSYLKKATIPNINENIQNQLKKLDLVMNQKPINLKDANKIKSLILGSLKQSKNKLDSHEQNELDKLITKFDSRLSNEADCNDFHYDLLEISSYMIETQKESNWS